MTVNLSALAGAGQQFFDNNGNPLSGGKLWSYEAGTTTPQTTYTNAAGSVAHTNPIVLDSAGRVPGGQIWITAGQNYKFVLMSSTDVQIAVWDNITGINGTGITSNASTVTYDPAGTGAVATNVQSKLRETVSVKDFGAVGDGVTDDTVAIQNALATGKALYFPQPDSFYNVTTNLTINVPFEAGLYRVFGGSGVITLGANSVAEVHPHWWGAEATQVSTIDATVAAKNTAAFNAAFSQSKYVVLPSGNYQIDGTIVIRNSCHGNGNRTVFYPTGNITATSIRGIVNAEIGLFSVNYALVGASSSNICVHIALGSTSLNDQTVACRLHHIYGFNCHRVVQYLPGDLGASWNMTLEYIQGSNCSSYVIYFEADSVSTTLITIKNSGSISSPTGRGIYAINITEVHIYDCYIDNGASSAGSLLYCFAANVDVDGFHVEAHTSTINDSIGAPIWLRTSTGGVTVKNMYFADWTFTPGSAVPVFYMLLEGKSEVGSVSELNITVNNSATKYLANASTATSLNVTQYSPSSFYLAPITASYGVEPAAANISVGTSATTLLTTPLGGAFQVSQQCGLFLVNGVWITDGTYAFTDLILITATGANARTVVTVSSNSIGGAHARTYSISGADIKLAMATATYRVSIKGLMMPRSRA